jgi:hypothetical protein
MLDKLKGTIPYEVAHQRAHFTYSSLLKNFCPNRLFQHQEHANISASDIHTKDLSNGKHFYDEF